MSGLRMILQAEDNFMQQCMFFPPIKVEMQSAAMCPFLIDRGIVQVK